MKTVNNTLTNENPEGTGLIVTNNTLCFWDAEASGWSGEFLGITDVTEALGVTGSTEIMGV